MVDASGNTELSLEDTKKNAEGLRQERLANERKEEVRKKLYRLKLRFEDIIYRYHSNDFIIIDKQIILHLSAFQLS